MLLYFSYYQYNVKCPLLNTDVTRKDDDFYFLRDNLVKLYPSTMVRFFIIYFIIYFIVIIDSTIT